MKGVILKHSLLVIFLSGLFVACAPRNSAAPSENLQSNGPKEIRRGMSQAEVQSLLGSPDSVTRDPKGEDTWLYDQIASSANYSSGESAIGLSGATGEAHGYSVILEVVPRVPAESVESPNQPRGTLSVVMKFDAQQRVSRFSIHQSRSR